MSLALSPESASVACTVNTVWLMVVFSGMRTRSNTLGNTGALSLASTRLIFSVALVLSGSSPSSVAVIIREYTRGSES